MKHKRPPIPVLVLVVLLVLASIYFLIVSLKDKGDDSLSASGTIEAVSINIAPEIGGKVVEVYVDEGQHVTSGDPLFRLDDTLLQAQKAVALANLDLANAAAATAIAAQVTAQANYDLAVNTARLEAASARTSDWSVGIVSTTTQAEDLIIAHDEADLALRLRDAAQETLSAAISAPAANDFVLAEGRLLKAQAAFAIAKSVQQRASLSGNSDLRDAAQSAYVTASTELDDAQVAYDDLKDGEAAREILTARAGLAVAEERYQASQDRLLQLETGVASPRVEAALAALRQSQAAAEQAQLAIAPAEASLALLEAQIAKLTVTAPMDGVILTRNIQPGEVVPVGSLAMELARLDDLTITVYIPEDRYGELALGQSATVTVDSFPGETFEAVISHIADQAEFTPRNVQTIEGRSSTVYAIRLKVENPAGRLKPGMPADVAFR
jgi:HlyD family secretion protein